MKVEEEFRDFLKKKGKKTNVIERNVRTMKKFQEFLKKERQILLEETSKEDIQAFVKQIESAKKSAKGPLYVLMNYFKFCQNDSLLSYTSKLREERTKKTRRIFPIRKFMNINSEHVKKLASINIKNVKQMLKAGKTKVQRKQLAKQLDIPEEKILELVKLSDLTRLGYVKRKLTRLYYDAGLDSPEKIAQFEAEDLYQYFKKFVEESGWDGMVPNLSDLKHNIASARKLKKIVEE
jgi:DNA polymerase III gamma/tau subunit